MSINTLFGGKTHNPESLLYLAYKRVRLEGIDTSDLPASILAMSKDMDKKILLCDETVDDIWMNETLKDWDWSVPSKLPLRAVLGIHNSCTTPEWIEERVAVRDYFFDDGVCGACATNKERVFVTNVHVKNADDFVSWMRWCCRCFVCPLFVMYPVPDEYYSDVDEYYSDDDW